jgi:zinc D-Ala-D-Ala dipeptidase
MRPNSSLTQAASILSQPFISRDSIALATSDFVELRASAGLAIDLRYATSNNFMGRNLYGDFNKAFLHRIAAEKLTNAVKTLLDIKPTYKLIVLDALRPQAIQHILWDHVKGTEQEEYVADPAKGSIHSFGLAIDLSVLDESGRELDMGTTFDNFTQLAQPKLEDAFLTEGRLTERHIENRRLLRGVMEGAGFIQLPNEWWHFDALPAAEVRANYRIVA